MTLRVTPAEIVANAEASGRPGLLGVAPGWGRVRVGEVAAITNGAAFSSTHFNLDRRGLPLIRIRDIRSNETATWYDGGWEPIHLVEPGALLVGMDGDFNAAIWRGPVGLLNQRVLRIRVDERVYDARFFFYALQGYLDAIWKATSSTTVKHLSSRSVADIPLPFPPVDEQRRIVDILEDHLSRLDAATDGLRLASSRLRTLVEVDAISIVRGQEIKASVASPRLEEIALVGTGATPRRGVSEYWEGGEIPWVTSGELSQGLIGGSAQLITAKALRETSVKLWPAGTLLIAMYGEGKTRGTVGELGIAATTNQACAAVVLRNDAPIVRDWVRLVLESRYDEMRRTASGGVQPNLNLSHFRAMTVPIPGEAAMGDLLARHRELQSASQLAQMAVSGAIVRAASLRRALLSAAFSGQLTGRSSDLDLAEELAQA